jgi:hypothetical protein
MDNVLKKIYYDPENPASFSGAPKLYDAVRGRGYTLKEVKTWLSKQDTYTLYKQSRKNFTHPVIVPAGIDTQFEADLFDVASISKYNDGVRFGLLVIDAFSKYLWIVPLKTKKTVEVAAAFQTVLDEGRVPSTLRTDLGKEFTGKDFEALLSRHGIKHYYAYSPHKAVFAERCIKTVKSKIFKYISSVQNYRYLDRLQDIVKAYNASVHSSTTYAPRDVNSENESEVRYTAHTLRSKKRPTQKPRYKYDVGATVKISYRRGKFTREYDERWSGELFVVMRRYSRQGVPTYVLRDWSGEVIKGGFYEQELQKVTVNADTKYKISEILKKRSSGGKKEVLVRWSNWPDKYNSWIPAKEVKDLQTPT